MIAFKKSGENIYEAFFQKPVLIIDKHSGYLLKKEIAKIFNPNRKISIDFKLVKEIDDHGYKMLAQIVDMAEKKNCILNFKNPSPDINEKIQAIISVN